MPTPHSPSQSLKTSLKVAENPSGVSTPRLKIAALSHPLLVFDPGYENALCSLMSNSGRVRSGQLNTKIASGQLGLGHAALDLFRARSGQPASKSISAYSDTFHTQPNFKSDV